MNRLRRRWIIFSGWWIRMSVRHGRKSWFQWEYEQGDPDGIVRAYADQIIKEMEEENGTDV